MWQLPHLFWKIIFPSWADILIKEKIKKEANNNKRFGAKDFSGIIEAVDLKNVDKIS